jgi:formylglycine-generating enzyme required for sulfatase activity
VEPEPEWKPTLIEMIPVQGGVFWMGNPENKPGRIPNEGSLHEEELSDFELAKLPTTQGLYERIMGKNPGEPKGQRNALCSWFSPLAW